MLELQRPFSQFLSKNLGIYTGSMDERRDVCRGKAGNIVLDADGSAGTDWKMDTEILTYSRSKGVFAGLTLEGAVIAQDSDPTKSVYGRDVSFQSVLQGKVATPDIARAFMKAVAEAAHKAKSQETREAGQ